MFQSETLSLDRDTDGSVVLTLDVPGRGVNVLTRQVFADLHAALDRLAAEARVAVLVLRSGKKSGFLAGADLNEFRGIGDIVDAQAVSASGQQLFARLAAMPFPTVAVIHGPCLGGGLELALACDYRLVVDRPNTQLGLPEVELGLLPAWGGTVRLPRLIGLERALQVILGGKRLDAREAHAWGLADALARTEAELREQYGRLVVRAVMAGKPRRRGLPLRTWRQRLLESNPFGRRLIFQATERRLRQRVPDDMPAFAEAVETVRQGLRLGEEGGQVREREAAGRLAVSLPSRHLIELFFLREAARRLPLAMADARPVRTLGVVGGGVMGAGIAQLAALAGCQVIVQEVSDAALAAALGRIDELFAKAVARRRLRADEAATRRGQVRGTLAWEGFDAADLVIEAAVEDVEVKRNLFRELLRRTPESTVLASNTSSLALATIRQGLPATARLAGLHFFNPVHKMPLVEVAASDDTAAAARALLTRFALDVGKTPVQVGDGPGFLVNRVLMPYLDEAVRLVGEGMKARDVDQLMRRFGLPVGPLELLDEIGLDVAAHVAASMRQQTGTTTDVAAVFERMRQQGWLGAKVGRGFYVHGKKQKKPHPAAEALVREASNPLPTSIHLPAGARLADARERLVLLMVNEAAAALERRLAADAATVDLALVLGIGWAPHRGGPLQYADDRGAADIVRALDALTARLGPRFTPCAELRRRAAGGERFRSQ